MGKNLPTFKEDFCLISGWMSRSGSSCITGVHAGEEALGTGVEAKGDVVDAVLAHFIARPSA